VLVVVGLGNPGGRYADTRHNLGFRVVDELLRRGRARAVRGDAEYESAEVRLDGEPALLVKPTTYVNRSGRAVLQLLARYAVLPADLLVVVDDIDLPFGRLRLRGAGSAGGHNGMQSLLEALGTPEFARLRLGVGAPPAEVELADWVLLGFAPDELRALPEFVGRAADAVQAVARLGVAAAMPGVNAPPAPG
jgi:PTH1 family peptidyl-tRNA hydrolase